MGFTDVKKEVGFGMYCRHSPSLHHDKPALYHKYDFYHLFTEQMYFRISIICNTLASLLGLMLFWWALSLWCQYGNPLVMRTLTLMFIICAIFSAISHLLHFSRMCSIDVSKWKSCASCIMVVFVSFYRCNTFVIIYLSFVPGMQYIT